MMPVASRMVARTKLLQRVQKLHLASAKASPLGASGMAAIIMHCLKKPKNPSTFVASGVGESDRAWRLGSLRSESRDKTGDSIRDCRE